MGIAEILAENQRLREALAERDSRLAEKDAELAAERAKRTILESQNEVLAKELEKIRARRNGPTSERYTEADLLLPFTSEVQPPPRQPVAEDEERPKAPSRRKKGGKRKPRRRNLSEDTSLPHRAVRCTAPTDAACPGCGGVLKNIGTTTSNRYDWVPGRWVILDIERDKCVCPSCPSEGVLTAPDPFALPRAICGNGLLARVLVDKFADHIPLHRQCSRMKREGVPFATSTLSGWVASSADLLSIIANAIEHGLLRSSWLQGDDTGLDVQDGGNGALRKGRLWAFTDQNQVFYRFTSTKQGSEPAAILADFVGDLFLADAGSEFNQVVRELGLERAGCWSHLRRYFFEARERHPVEVRLALGTIHDLFMIERELHGAEEDQIRRVRDEQSRPLVDGFFRWVEGLSQTVRPKSALGDAIRYARNNEQTFRVYLEHPQIPLHNNLSELQLRQPIVGRKNWLFAGSEGGAKAATTVFTLIGSCILQAVDPWVYLTDVLERLPFHPANRVEELTPLNWKRAKEQVSTP